jgi:hypothetical protein
MPRGWRQIVDDLDGLLGEGGVRAEESFQAVEQVIVAVLEGVL